MLVLSRKVNESIILHPGSPEPIIIKVVGIDGCRVRIGIEASEDVEILRGELAERRVPCEDE